MATEIEKAMELIAKETKSHEARQKELKARIRELEGNFLAAQSDHKAKMLKLKFDSEMEEKALQEQNEPLRVQIKRQTDELKRLTDGIEKAKTQNQEQKATHNVFRATMNKDIDVEIAAKRAEVERLDKIIKDTRKMIGV